jgi:hypothetical protein
MTAEHADELREGKKTMETYFQINVVKSYNEPVLRLADEGTRMTFSKGKILNGKQQWHQPSLTRTVVLRGGAEVLSHSIPQ